MSIPQSVLPASVYRKWKRNKKESENNLFLFSDSFFQYSLVMAVRGIVNVEQIVSAPLEQLVVDVDEIRVLLGELELTGVVLFEDRLETLRLTGV